MNPSAQSDINAIEQQLISDGKAVLQQAKSALVNVVAQAAQTATGDIQKVEDSTIKIALDFVPTSYRAIVSGLIQPVVAQAESQVNPELQKIIASAVARIDAALK